MPQTEKSTGKLALSLATPVVTVSLTDIDTEDSQSKRPPCVQDLISSSIWTHADVADDTELRTQKWAHTTQRLTFDPRAKA